MKKVKGAELLIRETNHKINVPANLNDIPYLHEKTIAIARANEVFDKTENTIFVAAYTGDFMFVNAFELNIKDFYNAKDTAAEIMGLVLTSGAVNYTVLYIHPNKCKPVPEKEEIKVTTVLDELSMNLSINVIGTYVINQNEEKVNCWSDPSGMTYHLLK